MCLPNNSSMEEVYKAQVECLQKELAKRDEEIQHLKDLLNIYDKNQWSENKVKVIYDKEREDEN